MPPQPKLIIDDTPQLQLLLRSFVVQHSGGGQTVPPDGSVLTSAGDLVLTSDGNTLAFS